jgi:hypothetical protein
LSIEIREIVQQQAMSEALPSTDPPQEDATARILQERNRLPREDADYDHQCPALSRLYALLMPSRAETGYATMGVITSDAGVGKTIACKFGGDSAECLG